AGQTGDSAYFVNSRAIRQYDSALISLQDENIINLSKDFSVYRYGAIATEMPQLIVPVKLAASQAMSAELVARLQAYVTPGATQVSGTDAAFLQACLDEAIALVDNECGTAVASVPMAVLHRAYIEVGSELYNRRSAP